MVNTLIYEPNTEANRPLNKSFFVDRMAHIEAVAAYYARESPGLTAPVHKELFPPLFWETSNLLKLRKIRAVGEKGYPIVAGPPDPDLVKDVSAYPAGSHTIFVCISREKTAHGDPAETPGLEDQPSSGLYLQYQRREVTLAVDEESAGSLDRLPIARFDRVLKDGELTTVPDGLYHPPIRSMAAYGQENPLTLLAERALIALDERPREDPCRPYLRAMLIELRGIAEVAPPIDVFPVALRVVAFIRSMAVPILALDGQLETYRYSYDTFCSFLAKLRASLLNVQSALPPYPPNLEIDGKLFRLLEGRFVEQGDFFVWGPAEEAFNANAYAIYTPGAELGTMPHTRYSTNAADRASYRLAKEASRLSAPGTAILLSEFHNPVGRFYVAANSDSLHEKLRRKLEDGHAVYYY